MQWIGTTSEGEEAKGQIRVTEFSHEVLDGLSEYCVSSRFLISRREYIRADEIVRDDTYINIYERCSSTPYYPQKSLTGSYYT